MNTWHCLVRDEKVIYQKLFSGVSYVQSIALLTWDLCVEWLEWLSISYHQFLLS